MYIIKKLHGALPRTVGKKQAFLVLFYMFQIKDVFVDLYYSSFTKLTSFYLLNSIATRKTNIIISKYLYI